MRCTNKQTETCLIHFDAHRGLSQSEKNVCEHTVKMVLCLYKKKIAMAYLTFSNFIASFQMNLAQVRAH